MKLLGGGIEGVADKRAISHDLTGVESAPDGHLPDNLLDRLFLHSCKILLQIKVQVSDFVHRNEFKIRLQNYFMKVRVMS